METTQSDGLTLAGAPARVELPEMPETQAPAARREAGNDEQLMALWLHGRPEHTQRAYRADADRFLTFVAKGLRQVTLSDVQNYLDALAAAGLSPASQGRRIAAVKSLLAFAHRLGYVPFDVGAPVKSPKVKDTLAERILAEDDVMHLLKLEKNRRNHCLLRLMYRAGLRVSEVTTLAWRDCAARDNGQGQLTIYGKGQKTRFILLPETMWKELMALKPDGAKPEEPVFVSRKGRGFLDASMVARIVRAAAKRAGIEAPVSPHWLRHAHASHSIDRGAPISLVSATLGHASMATTGRYLHARPSESSSRYLVG